MSNTSTLGRDHIDLTPNAASSSDARAMVLVVYGLYFAGFLTSGLTTLIGLVLAYVSRGAAPEWAATHYSFQIRTFWLTLLASVLLAGFALVSIPMILVLVGILMLLMVIPMIFALLVWYGVRCGVGFNHALSCRAYPDPETLLI